MARNIFRWEIFLQTKFRLLVTKYFITESQFSCSEFTILGECGVSSEMDNVQDRDSQSYKLEITNKSRVLGAAS